MPEELVALSSFVPDLASCSLLIPRCLRWVVAGQLELPYYSGAMLGFYEYYLLVRCFPSVDDGEPCDLSSLYGGPWPDQEALHN